MTIAIMQPYLFPYLGYFQLIHASQKFLLLDDVAYINKGWINRNRILLQGQPHLLSFPIMGASQNKTINELELMPGQGWKQKIEKTVTMAYKKAPCFDAFFPLFHTILMTEIRSLTDFICHSLQQLCGYLKLPLNLVPSTRIYQNQQLAGQARILALCQAEKADRYINPPGGRGLYDEVSFRQQQVQLSFLQPSLPAYPQLGARDFVPALSIIDVLMHCTAEQTMNQINQYDID